MNFYRLKKSRPFLVVVAVLALLVICIVVAQIQMKSSGAMQQGGARGGRSGRGGGSVVSVKTQVLEKTTLHGYVATNGEIESQNSVSVFPDVAGKVISMNVMLGSRVSKGQIIGYIDPSSPGSYYRQSPIYAPISGSVISTPLKNGTTVSTGTAITQVGDVNNLQIRANVPERYVAVLKVGLKANISVEAYPGVVFKATVSRVSPVVDSASRTKEIVLVFDERDFRVNAGMFAKVILFTEDYSGEVTMPSDSLVQNGDKFYAYTVNADSTVTKNEVTLGKTVDGIVQITSGLNPGEKVVVQGQTSLANGSKVQDITNGIPKTEGANPSPEKAGTPQGAGGAKSGKPDAGGDARADGAKRGGGGKPSAQ